MTVHALADYQFLSSDALARYKGKQLLYINWEKHRMFSRPFVLALPPDTPFGALSAETADLYEVFDRILEVNLAEPKVFVHRDYHSRNLMHLPAGNPGVLDFQDAVYGPITYDLVSLFKDAYIHWEEDFVLDMLARYWETARALGLPVRADFAEFHRDYEWMGVQRHIKVLGIFARLYHRDGKDGYLKDMPLVLHYLRKACERYGELRPLLRLLEQLEPSVTEVGYSF